MYKCGSKNNNKKLKKYTHIFYSVYILNAYTTLHTCVYILLIANDIYFNNYYFT